MSIILPLSTLPAERLKARSDSGLFPWDDPDAAKPYVEEACADSGGDPEREAELILLALQENVAIAIRRALDRNPEVRMERILRQVAEYYGALPHIASKMNPTEARWSVDTLAAMASLIPSSEVGATASMPKAPPRPTSPPPPPIPNAVASPQSAIASPQPSSALPPPAWVTTQAASSLPPWVQASNTAAAPLAPAATHATTSLSAPPGTGIAAGAGVPLERGGVAPGAWPPQASSGYGRGLVESGTPEEVEQGKWSWAGFLGGAFWMWAHKLRLGIPVWLGVSLLSQLLPLEVAVFVRPVFALSLAIYLGLNGNRLGWDYRQYNSVKQFRTVQRIWIVAGAFIFLFFTAAYCFNIATVFWLASKGIYASPSGSAASTVR